MDVKTLGPGHTIELYVKPGCPYCAEAEAFYRRKGLQYKAYNAQDNASTKRRMLELAGGNPTTPAIVIDGVYVQSGWGQPPRG